MANPTYTAGSYAGEFSGKILGAALLSASTLDAGAVTIMPNVKYKSVLQVGAWANVVKGASCDFDATTTSLTLTEKVLETKELQANAQLCKKELRDEWQAIEMGFSAYSEIPASFGVHGPGEITIFDGFSERISDTFISSLRTTFIFFSYSPI